MRPSIVAYRKLILAAVLVLIAMAAACSAVKMTEGDDGFLPDEAGVGDDAGAPDAAPDGAADPFVPVQKLFIAHCATSGCHLGGSAPEGLDLSAAKAYESIVRVASTEEPTQLRVSPGSPQTSYLLCKIDPHCAVQNGTHMPQSGALTAPEVALVRAWITAGARSLSNSAASGTDTHPPVFAGLTMAAAVDSESASLTWKAAQDLVTPAANLTYLVYQGSESAHEDFSSPAATVTGTTTGVVSGLTPLKTYYFVVRARDAAGNTDQNAIERSVTIPDQTPPTFAGVETAVAAGPSSVALTWSSASDNADPAANIRYSVYIAEQAGAEDFKVPALTTANGATSATVSGLNSAQTYYFAVRAKDSSGNEDTNTVEQSATTSDGTAPMFAGVGSVTATADAATINWSAASDNTTSPSAISYLVYDTTTAGSEDFTHPVATTGPGQTSALVSGLAFGTTYYFVVRAKDGAGNIDANFIEKKVTTGAAPPASDTTAPTFGAPAVEGVTDTTVTLAWTAATDNATAKASIVYLVFVGNASGGENMQSPTFITSAGATSFTVTGLSPSTKRWFIVLARDLAGNTGGSGKEVATTTAADTTAPTFAGATSAVTASRTSVTVSWGAATDDVTPATGIVYEIFDATKSGGETYGQPSFTTVAGATSFLASGLSPGTTYDFVVRAKDAAGNVDKNTLEVKATTTGVSLANDVVPIFDANCKGCHGNTAPSAGLNLNLKHAYTGLVGVTSTEGNAVLVVAGSPSTSYLVEKLNGSGPDFTGALMPKGASALSAANIATISAWIAAGAPNN